MTWNDRPINPVYAPLVLTAVAVIATVFLTGAATLAALIAELVSFLVFAVACLILLFALSYPVIHIVDKLLKRSGRKGLTTVQKSGGKLSVSISLALEAFKKISDAPVQLIELPRDEVND